MGTVVEAYDTTLDRTVALKLLHGDLGDDQGRRLLREARALARLSHPNVVHVHEAGHHDGRAFIAMELIRGRLLRDWQRGPRPYSEVLAAYQQAGRGLAAAHAAGLVHRDFKPGNCMIDHRGRVRVLDFGLVGDLGVSESSQSLRDPAGGRDESVQLTRNLTQLGAVVGTLVYMAPEQLCGRTVDAKSDQFSFCTALFEALTGTRPFPDHALGDFLSAIMSDEAPTFPRRPRIPGWVRRAVLRGLSRDPDARWPSVDALLHALERPAMGRRRWGVIGVIAWAAATAAIVGSTPDEVDPRCIPGPDPWDEQAQAQVRASLLAHDLPYAERTWLEVRGRLDRHAAQWARERGLVCSAAAAQRRDSDAHERRLACLDRQRDAIEQTVDVLGLTDPIVTARAIGVVSGLRDARRCGELASLGPPRPTRWTPEDRAMVRALERARALRDAGQPERAARALSSMLLETETTGRDDLRAQALRMLALVEPTPEAPATARVAYELALAAEDHATAALTAAELAHSLDTQPPRRPRQTRRWLERAHAAAADLGPSTWVAIARIEASWLERHEELSEAQTLREEILAVVDRAHRGAPLHPDVITSHAELARLLTARGHADHARDHATSALVSAEALFGPEHPRVDELRAALFAALEHRSPRASRP